MTQTTPKTAVEMDTEEFILTYRLVRFYQPKNNDEKCMIKIIMREWENNPYFARDGKGWRFTQGYCRKCNTYVELEKDSEEELVCDCARTLILPETFNIELPQKYQTFIWDRVKEGNDSQKITSLSEASYNTLIVIEELAKKLNEHQNFLNTTTDWQEGPKKPVKVEDKPAEGPVEKEE